MTVNDFSWEEHYKADHKQSSWTAYELAFSN